MAAGKLWKREELIVAFNLYCKIPFGKIHISNPKIIELANLLGRTPSAISWKLVNFASMDPQLQARGIKGALNKSKKDEEVWNEFFNNWDELAIESEKLLAEYKEKREEIPEEIMLKSGEEKERVIKARVNQSFFRTTLLNSYNSRCCITGIDQPNLLIAAHIIPWAIDKKNRLNPLNGLLLNALHDKAFEYGFISIDSDYRIKVCADILDSNKKANKQYFWQIHDKEILLPERFLPNKDFLSTHFDNIFKG